MASYAPLKSSAPAPDSWWLQDEEEEQRLSDEEVGLPGQPGLLCSCSTWPLQLRDPADAVTLDLRAGGGPPLQLHLTWHH